MSDAAGGVPPEETPGELPPPAGADLAPPSLPLYRQPDPSPSGDGVIGALARQHRRSRAWPTWGQVAWWALLLPVALLCWGASRTGGVRTAAWIGAAAALLFGVLV